MDLITFDVTAVPEEACRAGMMVELIGERHTADDLAREAGTIGYEILTALGRRFFRDYRGSV
jgi:alanine racemase